VAAYLDETSLQAQEITLSYLAQLGAETADFSGLQNILTGVLKKLWASDEPKESGGESIRLLGLPGLCCAAVGGENSRQTSQAITAAWVMLYSGIFLLDKIEDQEMDSDFLEPYTAGQWVNFAAGLLTIAELILLKTQNTNPSIPLEKFKVLGLRFNASLLKIGWGQHLDLDVTQPTLDGCWQIAAAKSGEFFALACYAGACCGTGDETCIQAFETYGFHLGMVIQIANDLEGLLGKNGKSDLTRDKVTLPVAYALETLPYPDATILQAMLRSAAAEPSAEQAIRDQLWRCGAVLYIFLEAEKHALDARNALQDLVLDPAIGAILSSLPETIVQRNAKWIVSGK
jgi:hypothetical protein